MLKYSVMRRLALVVITQLLIMPAGCHDAPALDIDISHPAGLAIAETDVTVYESPTVTCGDVEFGRLDDAQLAALTTADETLATGGATTGTLDGISRTANKIIVVRDYDATGALLAAGCTALGSVSTDTTVAITTIVAATVAILPPSQAGSATTVSATDPNGAAIDGRAISWTVYGPAGTMPATTTGVNVTGDGEWSPAAPTCTSQGTAEVHVVPPSTVDGYAVQLQVAWATSAPPLFSDLTSAQFALQSADGPEACAIRHHGGAQSLVCLTPGTMNAIVTDYNVTASGGVATIAQTGSAAIAKSTFALVSLPNGSDLDVYGLDNTGAVTNLFDAPPTTLTTPCTLIEQCDDAIVVPACGSDEPTRILIHQAASGGVVVGTNGASASSFSVPGLFPKFGAAGCVTQLTGSGSTVLQASTFTSYVGSGTAGLEETYGVACNAMGCASFDLERGGIGVGFISGPEPRIVLESIDATGVVLVEAVLSAQTNGVIERSSVPAASIPERIVSGQFDTDGDPDLLWDIAAGTATTSFEVAYAKLAGTQPLEALSPAVPATVSQILVGDLTGDGIDDLAILATGSGSAGVAVVPMGAPTPVTVTTDPTCAAN